MQLVTSRYLSAIANPHRLVAEVIVTLPGESTGTQLDIEQDQCTVTMSGSNGSRYAADIALSPDFDTDVYALVSTPGAEVAIRSGVMLGLASTEWVRCGVFYATVGDRGLTMGDVPLTLQDGSVRIEECRFTRPWAVASGTDRGDAITAMITDASPDVTVTNRATDTPMGSAVYDRDRLDAINTIAKSGNLDAAFDAAGGYLIQDQPLLKPTAPVWTLRTGEHGTILPDARRNIPLDRLYNTVIVGAPEAFQTWGAITVTIADTSHPRHSSKIGVRPFFVSDPTIGTQAAALARANATLLQLLNVVEDITIPTLGNPALEYGDTIAVVHQATATDPGLAANYLVESWTFNLGTGAMDITGRSTDQPELEEA